MSALLLFGCASSQSEHATAIDLPTPKAWLQESVWQFHIVDISGEWIGSIDLALYSTGVDTCNDGNWRDAEILRSTADDIVGGRSVAYQVDGANLWIDLNANICDANTMLQGQLLETGATGEVYFASPWKGASHDIGRFTAAPLSTVEQTCSDLNDCK